MKFKTPTADSMTDGLLTVIGIASGAALSDGVANILPGSDLVKRGGIAVVSGVGAATVQGNDNIAKLVKASLLGMAAGQTVKLLRNQLKGNAAVLTPGQAELSSAQKFLNGTLGLACPEVKGINALASPGLRAALTPQLFDEPARKVVNLNSMA